MTLAHAPDLPRGRAAWSLEHRRPWKRADVTDVMVVCAVNDAQRPGVDLEPFQLLMALVGCPFKVAVAAMKRALRKGLIRGGITSKTARITQAGVCVVQVWQVGRSLQTPALTTVRG